MIGSGLGAATAAAAEAVLSSAAVSSATLASKSNISASEIGEAAKVSEEKRCRLFFACTVNKEIYIDKRIDRTCGIAGSSCGGGGFFCHFRGKHRSRRHSGGRSRRHERTGLGCGNSHAEDNGRELHLGSI